MANSLEQIFGTNVKSKTSLSSIFAQPEKQTKGQELKQDIKQIGTGISEAANKRTDKFGEAQQARQRGEQSAIRTGLQQFGQGAGFAADVASEAIIGAGKALLSQKSEDKVKEVVTQFGQDVAQRPEVQKAIEWYTKLPEKQQRDLDAIGGIASLTSEFIGGAGVKTGVKPIVKGVEAGVDVAKQGIKSTTNTVGDIIKKSPETLSRFISPDVDPKFATALKRTTKSEVDEMESIVKNAVENADNPSAFEVVGNKLADATEQVNNQVKSLSQQKKTIIQKAKNGLTDFSKETGTAILDINRALKDSKLAKSFIERLKKVKTKIDADGAIDELQDVLYKGNKDLTIPTGSVEDMTLKRILGKYNSSLKDGLPSSYKKINESISEKLSNLDLLNKSLGEVVDGVPIRGASLIKQYFSPAGTKAKELFEFIKKNTGYDIGKDAVLAKYMSEIYGETRAKSLLQGLPTTAQGTIDKLLEFTLKKTGVAGKLSDLKRKGEILKAKELSK